jgi:hypothetical protein
MFGRDRFVPGFNYEGVNMSWRNCFRGTRVLYSQSGKPAKHWKLVHIWCRYPASAYKFVINYWRNIEGARIGVFDLFSYLANPLPPGLRFVISSCWNFDCFLWSRMQLLPVQVLCVFGAHYNMINIYPSWKNVNPCRRGKRRVWAWTTSTYSSFTLWMCVWHVLFCNQVSIWVYWHEYVCIYSYT